MKKNVVQVVGAALLVAATVSACGGGGSSSSAGTYNTVNDAVSALKAAHLCPSTKTDPAGLLNDPARYHAQTAVVCMTSPDVASAEIQGFTKAADRDAAVKLNGGKLIYVGKGNDLWLMEIQTSDQPSVLKALNNEAVPTVTHATS